MSEWVTSTQDWQHNMPPNHHTRKKHLLYAINTYHCLVTFIVLCLLSKVDILCNEDGMLGKVEKEQGII